MCVQNKISKLPAMQQIQQWWVSGVIGQNSQQACTNPGHLVVWGLNFLRWHITLSVQLQQFFPYVQGHVSVPEHHAESTM